jgi:hypothetical protein
MRIELSDVELEFIKTQLSGHKLYKKQRTHKKLIDGEFVRVISGVVMKKLRLSNHIISKIDIYLNSTKE